MIQLLLCGTVWAAAPPAEEKRGKRYVTDVVMRDGVRLHTKVMLPAGEGPWPTLLIRVPYTMGPVLDARCGRFNTYGYACVWQSVRGRGGSEGEWVPFENEVRDGLDTLDWLLQEPFVDGTLGMVGESYLGAAQWAMAADLPPEVKTLVPTVIGTDFYAAAYEGGLFRHEVPTAWMALMPDSSFHYLRASKKYQRALRHRPRGEMDQVVAKATIPWFQDWLAADHPDSPFWHREIAELGRSAPARTQVPVLMMGGWADAFLGPQLSSWSTLATKDQSVLMVGPWDHLSRVATDVKQVPVDDALGIDKNYVQWNRVVNWLDHHLKGEPLEYPLGVLTFPINGDGWVLRKDWPPSVTPLVLGLGQGGDPSNCTGLLGTGQPGEARWTYDPNDPTPAIGGAGVLAGALPAWKSVKPGFVDQGRLCERRPDLIGFRGAPLAEAVHVAGKISATLVVSTSAEDSAVNLRVLEERADGRRIHVRETIQVLSHVGEVRAGEPLTVELETWPVEYVFEAGSRILVQVASASYPKYEAHANTLDHWTVAVEPVVAQQTLTLEGSRLVLPVVSELPAHWEPSGLSEH